MPSRRTSRRLAASLLALGGLAGCGGVTGDRFGSSSGAGEGGGGVGGTSAGGTHNGGTQAGGTHAGGAGAAGTGGIPGDELRRCDQPSDCVVVPATCCGVCGQPTVGDVTAVRADRVAEHSEQVCGDEPRGCPDCMIRPTPELVAGCIANRCEAVDLRAHPSTACQRHEDCRVRTPDCCECGGAADAWSVVAVSDSDALTDLVCDEHQGCPKCMPVYPAIRTRCDSKTGHCVILDVDRGEPWFSP